MHTQVGRHVRELADEAMPAADLERDQAHVSQTSRHLERLVDPARMEDVDLAGAELDRAVDRDAVDDASVNEVLAADLDGRQQPRDGGRGEDRVDERPAREPVLRGPLDRGGDALERNLELLERLDWEQAGGQAAKRAVRADVRAGAEDARRAREPGGAQYPKL